MSAFKIGDRVLVKPLGVKGKVVRFGRHLGLPVVQADSGGPPLPWEDHDLIEVAA